MKTLINVVGLIIFVIVGLFFLVATFFCMSGCDRVDITKLLFLVFAIACFVVEGMFAANIFNKKHRTVNKPKATTDSSFLIKIHMICIIIFVGYTLFSFYDFYCHGDCSRKYNVLLSADNYLSLIGSSVGIIVLIVFSYNLKKLLKK